MALVNQFMTAQSTVATRRWGFPAIVTLAAMATLAALTADAAARQARPVPTTEAGTPNLPIGVRAPANIINRCNSAGGKTRHAALGSHGRSGSNLEELTVRTTRVCTHHRSCAVGHDEAGAQFLNRPGRREATGSSPPNSISRETGTDTLVTQALVRRRFGIAGIITINPLLPHLHEGAGS